MRTAFAATLTDPEFLAEAKRINLEITGPIFGKELQELILKIYATPEDIVTGLQTRPQELTRIHCRARAFAFDDGSKMVTGRMRAPARQKGKQPLAGEAVARLLVEIGQRLTLGGENPYKARAYSRAAESLQSLTLPLDQVVARDQLRDLPGVGAALAGVIRDLCLEGTTPRLEELRKQRPPACSNCCRCRACVRRRSPPCARRAWRASPISSAPAAPANSPR